MGTIQRGHSSAVNGQTVNATNSQHFQGAAGLSIPAAPCAGVGGIEPPESGVVLQVLNWPAARVGGVWRQCRAVAMRNVPAAVHLSITGWSCLHGCQRQMVRMGCIPHQPTSQAPPPPPAPVYITITLWSNCAFPNALLLCKDLWVAVRQTFVRIDRGLCRTKTDACGVQVEGQRAVDVRHLHCVLCCALAANGCRKTCPSLRVWV